MRSPNVLIHIVAHGGSTVYHDEDPPPPAPAPAKAAPPPPPETVRLIAYGRTHIITVGNPARTVGSGSSVAQSCQDKWNNDDEMIEYCINQQSAAQNRIGNVSVPQMCWDKWNKDYQMVEYCANQQNAARDRVMGK